MEGGWFPEGPPPEATGAVAPVEPEGVAGGSAVQLHRTEPMLSAPTSAKKNIHRDERYGRTWEGVGCGGTTVISRVLYPHPPFSARLKCRYKSPPDTIRL